MSEVEDSGGARGAPEVERFCPTCERSYSEGAQHCPDDGTRLVRLAEARDPMIGRTIDRRFVVQERIGAGGMGAVYRALQTSVGREVAIKVIEQKVGRDRIAAKRFLREAKLASQLSQANTVGVIDFGQTEDGMLFLVMELVRGQTLSQVLRNDGVLSPRRAVRIAVQLCDALEAANRLSIVHRDLKPSNIIILDHPPGRDLLKVLDFGLAKSLRGESGQSTVTQSDVLLGTPLYISPEAVTGAGEDHRTDLYSLGVILYEMVAGRPPFVTSNVNMLIAQHAYDAPPALPGHVPAALAGVITRLLEKEPDRRFQSAASLHQALSALALDRPATGGATDPVSALAATADAASRKEALANTMPDPTTARRPTIPPAPTVDEQASPRSKLPYLLAGLLALGGAVGLAFAAGVFSSDPAPVATLPIDAAPPAPTAVVDPAPAAVPEPAPAPDAGVPDATPPPEPRTSRARRARKDRRDKPALKKPPELDSKPPVDPKPPTGDKKPPVDEQPPRIDYRLPE